MLPTLSPNDKLKIESALKDTAGSMGRMAAERDFVKNVRADICKELDLNKKVFAKLAKTYYKQNFDIEVELHEEFEKLYEDITAKKTP